jgi:VanZ family protein
VQACIYNFLICINVFIQKKYNLLFIFLFIAVNTITAQSDSSASDTIKNKFSQKRLGAIITTEAILYSGTLSALNELWYKGYPHSSFHLFNDNNEWLQMDKMGHLITSYSVGRVGIGLMKWSGVGRKKAIWYGGMLGSAFLNTVEVLDGFSSGWGFSIGDLSANTSGSLIVVAQELAWDEQRIIFKYSFQQSKYSKYNYNLLGKNLQENLIKDYNGQTYWLSVNLYAFMNQQTKFPKWLNLALGYGANGMVGARTNPAIIDASGNAIYFDRYRQFYLSLDIDLTRIKTKSKFLKTVFNTVGFIKFPAPAVEFNKNCVKGLLFGF